MYNVVIKLFCKKGDVEMAEKLVKEMSLNPELVVWNAWKTAPLFLWSREELEDLKKIVCDLVNLHRWNDIFF
jgi:pentatricopeptide repeat protein